VTEIESRTHRPRIAKQQWASRRTGVVVQAEAHLQRDRCTARRSRL